MGKKTLILSEKQVEQLKKVRQGLIAYENTEPDYEIGFEEPVDMSSYVHVVNEGNAYRTVLNEENRTQKNKCVENITNNVPAPIRRLLDVPLLELDPMIQRMLMDLPVLYNSVANNQNGCNRFIDYLRLNLYGQFGIGRNGHLVTYIPGISRIACHDLRFYAFDYSIRGGELLVFGKFLKLVKYNYEFLFEGNPPDPDFNGMSYEELMETYSDKIKIHTQRMNDAIDNGELELVESDEYEIIEIPDYISGNKLVPTNEGLSFLRSLNDYTDWCVCGANAVAEYTQYLSNGGKMYVCLKKGYKDIPKPTEDEITEACPLDEYGVSMINVIIGSDGMPDNITTRWNHSYGGENHKDLWYAAQLQKLLGVKYRTVFKRRETRELEQLGLTTRGNVNEEVKPSDIDLSSFEIKTELNPKFWKDDKLDSRIRLKLLDIADDFVDFLNVSWVEPEDITMTGSLANFTWNEEYSDIDLHILYDFKKVDERVDFVEGYFDGKKSEWNNKHENLSIFGFPIEVYVQNTTEKHTSGGVYSLEKNKWLVQPDLNDLNESDYQDSVVKKKVSKYMNQIDDLVEKMEKSETETDLETIYDKSITLYDKIKNERNNGLREKEQKELSNGNLIFKSLRRNGYIEKLMNLRNNSYDKCNSLS